MLNSDQPNAAGAPPEQAAPAAPANASRRRFARSGAAVAGVLLTLKSQPGMAANVCVTPSGYQSVKIGSPDPRQTVTCNGLTPEQWVEPGLRWPNDIQRNTWRFRDGFNYISGASVMDSTMKSLMKVSTPPDPTAWMMKYLSAAYLNMVSERSPVLTSEILNAIWAQWWRDRQYVPTAGAAAWQFADLQEYLLAHA